jgi:hypothetical protein
MKKPQPPSKKVRRIELAAQDQVGLYEAEIRQILETIAAVQDEPGMAEALVTDESEVGDFISFVAPADERRAIRTRIEGTLGVSVDGFLWQVGERLRARRRPHWLPISPTPRHDSRSTFPKLRCAGWPL